MSKMRENVGLGVNYFSIKTKKLLEILINYFWGQNWISGIKHTKRIMTL